VYRLNVEMVSGGIVLSSVAQKVHQMASWQIPIQAIPEFQICIVACLQGCKNVLLTIADIAK
jgi:hypothetical protein